MLSTWQGALEEAEPVLAQDAFDLRRGEMAAQPRSELSQLREAPEGRGVGREPAVEVRSQPHVLGAAGCSREVAHVPHDVVQGRPPAVRPQVASVEADSDHAAAAAYLGDGCV